MKRMIIVAIIMATANCFLLVGCYKDVKLPESASDGISGSSGGGTAVPAADVTFTKYVLPIFTSNCLTCHSGNEAPDLRAANAYNALINGKYVVAGQPENSTLYNKVASGKMPPDGPLKQTDIDIIMNWIKNGALNN